MWGAAPHPGRGKFPLHPRHVLRTCQTGTRQATRLANGTRFKAINCFQGRCFGATVWRKTAFLARFGAVCGASYARPSCARAGPRRGRWAKQRPGGCPAWKVFQRGAPEGESEGRQDERKGCWLDRRDQRLRDAVCSLARRLTARGARAKPGGARPLRRVRRAGGGGRPRLAWRSWRAARQITLAFWRWIGYYDGVAHGKWWLRTFHDAGAPLEHRGSSDRADATYHARGVRLPGRFYSGLL